jgi:hypothetical protein
MRRMRGSLSGLTSNMNIYPFSATDVACWDIVVMNVLKVGEAHKRRILLEKNGVPGFGLPCLEILSLDVISNFLHSRTMIERLVSLTWLTTRF